MSKNYTGIIAAGHSPTKPGARGRGGVRKEELDCIVIADKFASRAKGAGYNALLVPHDRDLKGTISWMGRLTVKPDWAIEVHENMSGAVGVIILYDASYPEEKTLAARFAATLAAKAGVPNIGAKPDTWTRFGRLGFVRQPGINFVVECSDVDNKVPAWLWADALLAATKEVFPIPKVTLSPRASVVSDGRLHRVSLTGTNLNYQGIVSYVKKTTGATMSLKWKNQKDVEIWYDGTLGYCNQIKNAILKYGYRSYVK